MAQVTFSFYAPYSSVANKIKNYPYEVRYAEGDFETPAYCQYTFLQEFSDKEKVEKWINPFLDKFRHVSLNEEPYFIVITKKDYEEEVSNNAKDVVLRKEVTKAFEQLKVKHKDDKRMMKMLEYVYNHGMIRDEKEDKKRPPR